MVSERKELDLRPYFALKTDIPDVSEFIRTSDIDLSSYVKTNDSRLSDARTPKSHTHNKSQITDFPTKVSAFTNDRGYLTAHQSLTDYAKKSEIPNVTNFITSDDLPDVTDFVTMEDVISYVQSVLGSIEEDMLQ